MENKNQNNPKAKNHTTLNTKLALPPQRVWSLCLSLNTDKTDIDFIPLQFHVKCTSRTRKLRTPSYLRWFWNWVVVPHEHFCGQTEAEVLVERGMAQSLVLKDTFLPARALTWFGNSLYMREIELELPQEEELSSDIQL